MASLSRTNSEASPLLPYSTLSNNNFDTIHDWEVETEGKSEWLETPAIPIKPVSIDGAPEHMLGEWYSTAISGNDITSSCLYAIGFCCSQADIYAPVSLLLVVMLLYGFRSVYTEVVEALPLNGGSYTLLLNVTIKGIAAFAACLTLLSYIATAVVSASTAAQYMFSLKALFAGGNTTIACSAPTYAMEQLANTFPQDQKIFLLLGTIGLLGLFGLLSLIGVSESAVVAFVMFIVHLTTLAILAVACLVATIQHPDIITNNYQQGYTRVGNPMPSILFGFSGALLGVTGFETSANFVEQQKKGVFRKTLRNMWIIVAIINPLLGVLAFGVLPWEQIKCRSSDLLAAMGAAAVSGQWLPGLVACDAALVLSGSIITSYVGVTGLMRRLALDRCIPMFFVQQNKWRKTNHWIIIFFFLVCSSLYLLLDMDVGSLNSVYTMSFLCVMALFAFGNMMLKYKRARLPRTLHAPWAVVIFCFLGVLMGLILTIVNATSVLAPFFMYYGITVLIVGLMFMRRRLLKYAIFALQRLMSGLCPGSLERVMRRVRRLMHSINEQAFVFFISKEDVASMNKAILYVRDNEQTSILKLVHFYTEADAGLVSMEEDAHFLDRCYPKLRIDFVGVKGTFCPETVEFVSQKLNVPKNLMFIGCPKTGFPFDIGTLGGVRVVTSISTSAVLINPASSN